MNESNRSEMAAFRSRHFLLTWDFILPLVILAIGTYIFRSGNLDILIQSRYYNPVSGWAFAESTLPQLIYHYGNLPALLLCLSSIVVFALGFSKRKYLPYRKLSGYLVLALLIGPGLVVNSILKDNWGRPRPREIVQFGGNYSYEAPLTYDSSSPGKSFPCGHATMGFYFFALGFILRKKFPRLALLITILAAFWGGIIGWVRVGQGGHFSSDVLWAGVIVYLSSFLLYRAFKLHIQPFYLLDNAKPLRKLKTHQKVLLAFLALLIVMGVLLATPYKARKDIFVTKDLGSGQEHSITINMEKANLSLKLSDKTSFGFQAYGFGFPGSKLKNDNAIIDRVFSFKQRNKGFFTELNCEAKLEMDSLHVKQVSVTLQDGVLNFFIPKTYTDTLYIAPHTKLLSQPSGLHILRINSISDKALWFDVPAVKLTSVAAQ